MLKIRIPAWILKLRAPTWFVPLSLATLVCAVVLWAVAGSRSFGTCIQHAQQQRANYHETTHENVPHFVVAILDYRHCLGTFVVTFKSRYYRAFHTRCRRFYGRIGMGN